MNGEQMATSRRADKATALERWADTVNSDDLTVVDTTALKAVMKLADQRATVESQLNAAVSAARAGGHSWSEIGLMLGVSKQAAQRKYAHVTSSA